MNVSKSLKTIFLQSYGFFKSNSVYVFAVKFNTHILACFPKRNLIYKFHMYLFLAVQNAPSSQHTSGKIYTS